MATPPTRIALATPTGNYTTTTSPKVTTTSLNCLVGDVVIVAASSEQAGTNANVTPTASAGTFTWSLVSSSMIGTTNQSGVKIWAGTCTAAGNATFSLARINTGTALWWGMSATQWRGVTAVNSLWTTPPTSGTSNSVAQSTSTLSLQANSAVQIAISDWNASTIATPSWQTINGSPMTGTLNITGASHATALGAFHGDVGAAGTKTVGLTTPATLRWVMVGVELVGTAGTGSTTGSGTASAQSATASGAGTATATGSGTSTAPAATASGAGTVRGTGSGSATASAATASGSGVASTTGTGSASAVPGVASGTSGTPTVTGTGTASAPAATAAGSGSSTATGAGSAAAPSGAASGSGTARVTGSGAATSTPAQASGSGQARTTGTGSATAAPGVASGSSGTPATTGSGASAAPPAAASGAGIALATGSGSAAGASASASGIGSVDGPPTEFTGRILSATLAIPTALGSIAAMSSTGDLVSHRASGRLSILRARGVIE